MNADFLKTCDKMYVSATTLGDNKEYYNSCYLSGYVVECYLKQIILKYLVKNDGTNYTVEEIKCKYSHKIHALIRDLNDSINMNTSIPTLCRVKWPPCQDTNFKSEVTLNVSAGNFRSRNGA